MRERGNILFLILLAIILFAALTYAVNSGLRGGSNNASRESAQAAAASINQYVALLRNEVQRLRLVNGCSVANLDWRHDYWLRATGAYTYYNGFMGAALIPKAGCAVFKAYGGPIAPQSFEAYVELPSYANYELVNPATFKGGHASIRWVNRVNEGTEAEDIALLIGGMRGDVCRAIMNLPAGTALISDSFYQVDNPNSAPSPITGTDRIDTAANLTGDFFIDAGGAPYCTVGAIIVSQ